MSPSLISSMRNRLRSGHIATSTSTLLPFSLREVIPPIFWELPHIIEIDIVCWRDGLQGYMGSRVPPPLSKVHGAFEWSKSAKPRAQIKRRR